MIKNENGILVLIDFFTKEVEVVATGYDTFEELVKSIRVDTSRSSDLCFIEKNGKNEIGVADFKEASALRKKMLFTEYIISSWGEVRIELTLTNGEVIKFQTSFDRFWIDTNQETLKIIRYEEIVKEKVGLK